MKMNLFPVLVAGSLAFASCNNQTETTAASETKEIKLKEENVTYTLGDLSMNGYVVFDENQAGARPAVVVVPEWWGLNDYAKMRARKLAELGYFAMAVDMYGDGKTADNPDSANAYAKPFYGNPQMAKDRIDAALTKLYSYAQADTTQIAAIGYCFGGAQVLNIARLGENLKGVVSFHGNLVGVTPDKNTLKAQILVCHGNADPFVPAEEVAKFKSQMDSLGIAYTFKGYDSATHAFTNPNATEMGKKFGMQIAYNAAADSASWADMREFFGRIFK